MDIFLFGENARLAGVVGCGLMVVLSMANGVLSVLTRQMQSIHFAVMMAYIALVSFILITGGLLIENRVSGGPFRILHYSGEQYLYGFACGLANIAGLLFKIIAY